MKYFKLSLVILAVAIISSSIAPRAIVAVKKILYSVELSGDSVYKSERYFPKEDGYTPKYEHNTSLTVLTNPCPKCQIQTKIFLQGKETDDTSTAVVTTMGTTATFTAASFSLPFALATPENPQWYRINLKRFDFTILKTSHTGYLWLNPSYPG